MAQIFLADNIKEELMRRATLEGLSMGKLILKLLEMKTVEPTTATVDKFYRDRGMGAPFAERLKEAPEDPNERWAWMKAYLESECGCTFDDDLEVLEVIDWTKFQAYNNGVMYARYMEAHPEAEGDK